jgi:hypothetical protein
MPGIDIARRWRTLRGEAPRPGAHAETAGEGITLSVTQECQATLPPQTLTADEVTVTVTSNRPGAAAQVEIGANLNSPDGSYQGPTTAVGQGTFTASDSGVNARFVVLPAAGWPVVGVGAVATWDDGTPESVALTYELLVCDSLVWWRWLIRIIAEVARRFGPRARSNPTPPPVGG